jgi:hypothetical protein
MFVKVAGEGVRVYGSFPFVIEALDVAEDGRARVGFANSGGVVLVHESAEEVAAA